MIEKLLSLFRPNLTKVLGQFNKAIANLEKIEADEAQRQAKAVATIAAAQARAEQAQQTAEQAAAVKANLRNLIGQ